MTDQSQVSRWRCGALTALAAAGVAVAGPHPSLPGPEVPEGLGVNIHFTDPLPGEMELLADAGFRWVRMDLGWEGIERDRGVYDFAAFDRLVAQLERHRLRALFILDYGNRLYETDRSVRTEAGRQAFARWAAAVVKRYQGRGYLWELWNEPNISFWKPAPNAADYAALARVTGAAIREAAPGEAFIGPATSGFDPAFMEACFERGALAGWDAVSVHPYRQTGPETVVADYGRLRDRIRRAAPAGREVPVLSGEWGYSAAWEHFDEDAQGRLLARQFLTNLAQRIPLSIWYDWRDDGADPKEPEHHFGTVGLPQRVDGRPVFRLKPAYQAARALTTTLRGHRFIRRVAVGTSDDWVLLFGHDRGLVVAGWTVAGSPRTVSLPVAAAGLVRDHLGRDLAPLAAVDGAVSVTLDGAPKYLRFDRPAGKLADLPAVPAFTCGLVRAPGGVMLALVDNPGGEAFAGSLVVTGVAGAAPVSLELAAGETARQIRCGTAATEDPVGLEIRCDGHPVTVLPSRRYLLGNPDLLAGCGARGEGDPKVASTQQAAAADPPAPLPGFEAPVWSVTCAFEPGWRYAVCDPRGDRTIPGAPTAFGLWVYGDGAGAGIRMRVRDAHGRTWQPDGGAVTWRGWRHVRLPLGPDTAHWGGQGDAVVRYPLQWDAPVLIDNLTKQAFRTRLFVTAPTLTE